MNHHQQLSTGLLGRLWHCQKTMKPLAKAGWVATGYVLAAVLAAGVIACHLLAIGGSSSPNYSGMNAFGDALLFLAVFGVAAIPATVAAFYFLRPYAAFWRGISVVALAFSLTSVVAFILVVIDDRSVAAGVAFLRILGAPLFATAFGLGGLFAPNRTGRTALIAASALEAAGFACWLGKVLLQNFANF